MRPILLLLVLTTAAPAFAQTIRHPFTFSRMPQTLPAIRWGSAAWADIDGDGDLDLFVTGQMRDDAFSSATMRGLLYRNDGMTPDASAPGGERLALTLVQSDLAGLAHSDASWTDYDGDGDVDLIVSGSTSADLPYAPSTVLYRNDGGALVASGIDLPALHSGTARWADHDGDGRADLYLTGTSATRAPYAPQGLLLVQNAAGGFDSIDAGQPALVFGDVDWSDQNADGRPDLLVTGLAQGRTLTALYRHTGSAYQSTRETEGRVFGNVARVADGWIEVGAVASRGGLSPTTRFVGQGVTNDVTEVIAGLFGGTITSGDLDGDGDEDLVLSGTSAPSSGFETVVYRVDGEDIRRAANLIGSLGTAFDLADVDGDLDLDLFVGGYNASGASTAIYRNETGNRRGIPATPGGLTSTLTPDGLALSWDAVEGVTYDVWVGTQEGLSDVRQPDARLSDGARLTTAAGLRTGSLTLRLPGGTYWWGVQAVSAERTGSAFASGGATQVVTSLEPGGLPTRLALGAAYPSPARDAFSIALELPAAAHVRADLFDATGRRVTTIADDAMAPGRHPLNWSGALASGVYLLRVETGGVVLTRPVHLLGR